jgi:2-oxoglutarate ferredoxin oxidoreductase subunit alpha
MTIKIAGESGQGINSIGEILAKALKNSGFDLFGYREYPSLIKGGVASYQLDFSDKKLSSPSKKVDLLVCVSRTSVVSYLKDLKDGGILVHSIASLKFSSEEKEHILNKSIEIIEVNAEQIAMLHGAKKIMSNVVLIGFIWNSFGLEYDILEEIVLDRYGKKEEYLEMNRNVLKAGYETTNEMMSKMRVTFSPDQSNKETYILTGNEAISLGAYAGGLRSFYAYPMTPASSILTYLAQTSKDTGILVHQVEDEITAAQMSLGSMYMGTRSMTGTSGGGFDLMTESLSLSGMAEIPWVCVLAQRPGPATGVPTWTATGDLNLAIYSGHGEFPRCVLAVSDIESSYRLIQVALNIAESYQIPVILLTEKHVAESLYNTEMLEEPIDLERGDAGVLEEYKHSDRYAFTENGVSPRWFPGSSNATYTTNSDEHIFDGSLTEDSESIIAMMDKRMKKLDTLYESLPEPVLYGSKDPEILLVGWGSVKSTIIDAMNLLDQNKYNVGYLHYEYLYPFKTELLIQLSHKAKTTTIFESNKTGQLESLILKESGIQFDGNFRKYDGRPYFLEEVYKFIERMQ